MKVILLTNILTPYRKNFYDNLYNELNRHNIEFLVLTMATTELGRVWEYNEFKANYTKLLKHKTINIRGFFIHLNFGYAKMLKKLKPDIVIAGGSYTLPAVWTSIRLKEKLGYKLLFWSESHLNETRAYGKITLSIRELIRKKVYSVFDGFWYAGKLSKKFIMEYASSNAKYIFVPNLVDENRFYKANNLRINKITLREKWNIPNNKFVFICPARLTNVKGIIPFLELFKEVSCKDNTIILIAGEGELRNAILKKGSDTKIDVRLVGNRSEQDIIEFYALADSFLMPSISDANPLTCIEAIWSGLPLLVSEHVGNHPETVKDGENGYVFSYLNKNKAILLIDQLVNANKSWLDGASKMSINIAKKNYETKDIVRKLVDTLIKW